MTRYILVVIAFFLVYFVIKKVIRSAIGTYKQEERKGRLPGDEMVLDPECQTYVVKSRAVTRRIGNSPYFFCSENCARQYAEKNRT